MPRILNSAKRNRRPPQRQCSCLSYKQCVAGLVFVLTGSAIMGIQRSLQAPLSSHVVVTRITDSSGDDDNENDVTATRIPSNSRQESEPPQPQPAAPQSEDEGHRDRPIFTLHVGPPKTATTFLQCSLCANHAFTDEILSQDGIVYLGTCPFHVCGLPEIPAHMIPHRHGSFFVVKETWESNPLGAHLHNSSVPAATNADSLPEMHPTFQAAIDRAYARHQNAVVIFEGCHKYTASHIAALAHHLTIKNDWSVQIVVAYRRLYEWLPSKYNSITKGATGGDWPIKKQPSGDSSGASIRNVSERRKAGKAVEAFHLDGRGIFSDLVREIEETVQHPTETVKRNYAHHFPNVTVIDLHNLTATGTGDPYFEHFVCRVLPSAVHTCRAVRAGRIDDSSKNPSVSFHYDMLAVAAHQKDIYTGQSSRSSVASAIHRRQENLLQLSPNEFPLRCLSNETVARLLNLSLKTEQNLFWDDWTAEQESEHRAGFAATLQKRKYCSLDTSATLKDAGWQSFLRKLP
jgi:hypothetical protein